MSSSVERSPRGQVTVRARQIMRIVSRSRHDQGMHQVVYKEIKDMIKFVCPRLPKRVYLKDLFYMQHNKEKRNV
jgi:hypothetical protein